MRYTSNRHDTSKRSQLFRSASIAGDAAPFEPFAGLIFKGYGTSIVTGPESKQVYCFSSHDPEQMIDARDAEALLKTGLFEIGT